MSRIEPLAEGWLLKKRKGSSSRFDRRYFVLTGTPYAPLLSWYKTDLRSAKALKPPLDLRTILGVRRPSKAAGLSSEDAAVALDLVFSHKTYTLACEWQEGARPDTDEEPEVASVPR